METPIECTLLDLLHCVNNITNDEHEATTVVVRLVNSGAVRLCGNFAGAKIEIPTGLSTLPQTLWSALLGLPS